MFDGKGRIGIVVRVDGPGWKRATTCSRQRTRNNVGGHSKVAMLRRTMDRTVWLVRYVFCVFLETVDVGVELWFGPTWLVACNSTTKQYFIWLEIRSSV